MQDSNTNQGVQKVQVEQQIDSVQMLIGQQTDFTLRVNVQKGSKVQFPEFAENQMITPGVEVVSMSPADTTELPDGALQISRHYTLTSFDDTLYYIPPQTILVDGAKYKSKNLALKVLGVKVDEEHPEKFYPIKDVQDNPFQWSDWATPFWCSWLMLIMIGITWYLYKRLKENKPVVLRLRIIKHEPPHTKAMKQIDNIKEDKLINVVENPKEYYTRLTDVLRHYMEERFGFSAMEMTTSEIIEHLQASADEASIVELKQLFQTADLVKFAKHSTMMGENDRNLLGAIDFIQTTKQENVPTEERIVPQLTDEQKSQRKQRRGLRVLIGLTAATALALLAYVCYVFWIYFVE